MNEYEVYRECGYLDLVAVIHATSIDAVEMIDGAVKEITDGK